MQIPQIRIETTHGKIEMSTTSAQQSIEQPQAIVSLEQPKAEVSMETTPGYLTIDQTVAWESMDIKHVFRRVEENAAKGNNAVLSGMARRASEGDELMQIEYGGNPLTSQGVRHSQMLDFSFNIGFIPPPFSVKMNYQPGKLNIYAEVKKVINNTVDQKPIIDYKSGEVHTSMRQHPDLKIDFVNIEV